MAETVAPKCIGARTVRTVSVCFNINKRDTFPDTGNGQDRSQAIIPFALLLSWQMQAIYEYVAKRFMGEKNKKVSRRRAYSTKNSAKSDATQQSHAESCSHIRAPRECLWLKICIISIIADRLIGIGISSLLIRYFDSFVLCIFVSYWFWIRIASAWLDKFILSSAVAS